MEWAKATFSQLLKLAVERLQAAGCDGAALDARLLLQEASGFDRSRLLIRENDRVPLDVIDQFENYIARREAREPVFRILGAREFHGLSLKLGPDTLEPRDDTECLVEVALDQISDKAASLRFLDLGTGSGAVVLALLSELPNARAVATDMSIETLKIAQDNATDHGLHKQLELVHGSWLEPVEGRFDFIVSNPPYIATKVVNKLAPEVLNHDPRVALDGGKDGLDAYREILKSACDYLKKDGFLAFEIGYDQLVTVKSLGESLGWNFIAVGRDLSGNDRAMTFKR
ncbi:MAG: peptide chain release factor N(5)-glutamine methyltransferase [Rhizobiaceae bacterium]